MGDSLLRFPQGIAFSMQFLWQILKALQQCLTVINLNQWYTTCLLNFSVKSKIKVPYIHKPRVLFELVQ